MIEHVAQRILVGMLLCASSVAYSSGGEHYDASFNDSTLRGSVIPSAPSVSPPPEPEPTPGPEPDPAPEPEPEPEPVYKWGEKTMVKRYPVRSVVNSHDLAYDQAMEDASGYDENAQYKTEGFYCNAGSETIKGYKLEEDSHSSNMGGSWNFYYAYRVTTYEQRCEKQ